MEQEEHQNEFPCMYEEHLKGERKEINKLIQYASAQKSGEKRQNKEVRALEKYRSRERKEKGKRKEKWRKERHTHVQ